MRPYLTFVGEKNHMVTEVDSDNNFQSCTYSLNLGLSIRIFLLYFSLKIRPFEQLKFSTYKK